MKKKISGKITKWCCIFLASILFLSVGYIGSGLFGGFDQKWVVMKSGYLNSFYEREKDNIQEVCGNTLTEDELFQIKIYLDIDKNNDKFMTSKYINEDGEEVNIQCEMTWFWGDNYTWSIVD